MPSFAVTVASVCLLLMVAAVWRARRPGAGAGSSAELLARALEREDQLRAELRSFRQELAHLEGFSHQLATLSRQEFPAVADLLLTVLTGLVPSQSQVLFLSDGTSPALRSPHRERIHSASLAKLSEPVLLEARQTRAVVRSRANAADARIFPDETEALAVALGETFVLYLGRPAPDYRPHEVSLLALLAQLAAPALEMSWKLARQGRVLEDHQTRQHGLETRLGSLDRILAALALLQSCTGLEALLVQLERSLREAIPHGQGGLTGTHRWPPEAPDLPAELAATDRLLLLSDLSSTRFAPQLPGIGSLLVCPLPGGCLWVAHEAPAAFQEEDGKALQTFAYQLGTLLENTRLHEETREALHKLQQSEEQLIQSGKMAAVGQLAAGIAHELNTPLGTVLLNLNGADKASRDEGVRKKLSRARSEVVRAREIVERLLHYSRLKSEDRLPTDLAELLAQSWSLLEPQFRLDGVTVSQVSDLPTDLRVPCQPNEIQQVFHNLLLNARDALQDHGAPHPAIEVKLRLDGERVCVEVTDSGMGVPPEIQSRIFEPFFTTKEVGRGTGLGLSLSRQILAKHGGELTMESRPGQTTFQFWLPLATNP